MEGEKRETNRKIDRFFNVENSVKWGNNYKPKVKRTVYPAIKIEGFNNWINWIFKEVRK